MTRMDEGHRRVQVRLRSVTAERLAGLIYGLAEAETQEAMDTYAPVASRIVAGGQVRASSLAMAYVETLVPAVPGSLPPTVERALAGVWVTEEAPVARSPVLRMWERLEEGVELPEAKREAASYAGELSSGDLQAAERGGLQEGARATGKKIKGWRKVLSSDPCEWCRTIAQATEGRYRAAETVPFHARDRCGVAPVFETN